MQVEEYRLHQNGAYLERMRERIEDGTPVISVQTSQEVRHLIAVPQAGLDYQVIEGGVLAITHTGLDTALRLYGSWLSVEATLKGDGTSAVLAGGNAVW